MARATELSEAEVFTQIDGLLANGEYPTAARLRVSLGQRGSPVVLQRFLANWYETHGPALAAKAKRHREAAAGGAIREQLAAAAKDALAQFDAQQAERVAALDARAAALDQREADLYARDRSLDEREIGQRELIETLRTDRQAAVAVQQAAQSAVARLEALLEGERQRAEALTAQIEQLHRDLDQRRDDLTRAADAVVEHRARAEATQAQLAAVQRECEAAQTALAESRNALREAEVAARQERHDALARQEAATLALRDAEAVRAALTAEHAAELAAAGEREKALQAALHQTRQALEAAQHQHRDDTLALGRMEGTVKQLQLERVEAAAKLTSLQENLREALERLPAPQRDS